MIRISRITFQSAASVAAAISLQHSDNTLLDDHIVDGQRSWWRRGGMFSLYQDPHKGQLMTPKEKVVS
jgi:hypothetical protein